MKKCWSSQFTVVLWDHNLKKQRLLSLFLKQRSLLHPSHLQEGRKGIKRSCLIRVVRMKGQDKQLILQVHHCPIWLCSPCAFGQRLFPAGVWSHRGLPLKNNRKGNVESKRNLIWSSLWFISCTRDINLGWGEGKQRKKKKTKKKKKKIKARIISFHANSYLKGRGQMIPFSYHSKALLVVYLPNM